MDEGESTVCIAYGSSIHREMTFPVQKATAKSRWFMNADQLAIDCANTIRETATTTKITAQKTVLKLFGDFGYLRVCRPGDTMAFHILQCLNKSHCKVIVRSM